MRSWLLKLFVIYIVPATGTASPSVLIKLSVLRKFRQDGHCGHAIARGLQTQSVFWSRCPSHRLSEDRGRNQGRTLGPGQTRALGLTFPPKVSPPVVLM